VDTGDRVDTHPEAEKHHRRLQQPLRPSRRLEPLGSADEDSGAETDEQRDRGRRSRQGQKHSRQSPRCGVMDRA
jgi:hypothetical protein